MSVREYAYGVLSCLPEEARRVSILAGGALRAYFDGTKVKDYDLFFRSNEDFDTAFFALNSNPDFETVGSPGGRTFVYRHIPSGREFNPVGICFGTPQEHMARFDFRCCRMAAWVGEDGLQFDWATLAVLDASTKCLVVLVNNGTERTLRRARHYIDDYGYGMHEVSTALVDEDDLRAYIENHVPRAPAPAGY